MTQSNGRPEPEVIMNVMSLCFPQATHYSLGTYFKYADGLSYSKGKMEEAFRPGGILEKPPTKATKGPLPALKREDIDLVVRFDLSARCRLVA